ncbi:hypothetical protein [Commensalibacter melissae]|uniref:hypothetical protein n=1 Tax=Commensalibacter melissae TaxID=2070537 RepID=UPI0012D95C75|nr:hypothetical protein [Commensalibacter melissae]MUG77241.1 hypothetical protein [Commensalibacter melissae]
MSEKILNYDSSAVQQHINILQNIITRLANNSVNCKQWCLAITAAVFSILASNKQISNCKYAVFPIITCWILDAYYLCIERAFRNKYEIFIEKLHSHNLQSTDLYNLKRDNITYYRMLKAFFSLSVILFYPFLIFFCLFKTVVRIILLCLSIVT